MTNDLAAARESAERVPFQVNGDVPQRIDRKLLYVALNAIRNSRPYAHVDPALRLADFPRHLDDPLAQLPGTPSPSRALSDLFWMRLPWPSLERALGPLRVFDIGCGSGAFGGRLRQWSGGRVASYVGLDVRSHSGWQELTRGEANFRFVEGDAEEADRYVPEDTNLIVSQSALEHVPSDRRCILALRRFVSGRPAPILQVHLVPSQACLPLYRLHGFRQYTPRTLSRLTAPYGSAAERMVVRLGGRHSNDVHRRWITGHDRRNASPDSYRAALADAILRDQRQAQRSPAFYALIVSSRVDPTLLDAGNWGLGSVR